MAWTCTAWSGPSEMPNRTGGIDNRQRESPVFVCRDDREPRSGSPSCVSPWRRLTGRSPRKAGQPNDSVTRISARRMAAGAIEQQNLVIYPHEDAADWDPVKAAANRRKHGVSFETALRAFADPFAISERSRSRTASSDGGRSAWWRAMSCCWWRTSAGTGRRTNSPWSARPTDGKEALSAGKPLSTTSTWRTCPP